MTRTYILWEDDQATKRPIQISANLGELYEYMCKAFPVMESRAAYSRYGWKFGIDSDGSLIPLNILEMSVTRGYDITDDEQREIRAQELERLIPELEQRLTALRSELQELRQGV